MAFVEEKWKNTKALLNFFVLFVVVVVVVTVILEVLAILLQKLTISALN